MIRFFATTFITLFLFGATAFAETPDGTFAVRVPSKTAFVATVTLKSGKVTGFTMERNETVLRASQVTDTAVIIEVEFLGSCGAGSRGRMNFDIVKGNLIFRQWEGRCESKKANFSVRKKIKTTKQ